MSWSFNTNGYWISSNKSLKILIWVVILLPIAEAGNWEVLICCTIDTSFLRSRICMSICIFKSDTTCRNVSVGWVHPTTVTGRVWGITVNQLLNRKLLYSSVGTVDDIHWFSSSGSCPCPTASTLSLIQNSRDLASSNPVNRCWCCLQVEFFSELFLVSKWNWFEWILFFSLEPFWEF